MTLQLAVHVIIVQLPQIIGKPLVPDCQQPEEGGFASPLTAYQTQHDFKLASGLKCPCNRPQHEQLQGFIGVIVHISSQKVPQTEADALRPVPCKAVQKIPDGVVLILIRHNPDGGFNLFLTGKPVGFLQIEKQILHVRIGQGCAFSVKTDGLYDVLAVGQDVVGDCPGKHRVTLEYGQAVPYALADAAFLGGFQSCLYFLNALGRLHGVHGVF